MAGVSANGDWALTWTRPWLLFLTYGVGIDVPGAASVGIVRANAERLPVHPPYRGILAAHSLAGL
jgi:hypothetical protein